MSIDEKAFIRAYAPRQYDITEHEARGLTEDYEAAKAEQPDDCRAAFEKDAGNTCFDRDENGKYEVTALEKRWVVWQRAWSARPKRESGGLEEENRILREAMNPHKGVKGLYPLILYFDNRQEADEFTDLVQQAKPGMRSYKI